MDTYIILSTSRAYILKGEGGHNYISAVSGIHVCIIIKGEVSLFKYYSHFSQSHIQFRCVYIHTVYSNPEKTVLAILLLRMFISSEGLVRPVHHGGYTPRSLSQRESVSEGVIIIIIIIIGCEVICSNNNYVCMCMGWSCCLVISSNWSPHEFCKSKNGSLFEDYTSHLKMHACRLTQMKTWSMAETLRT